MKRRAPRPAFRTVRRRPARSVAALHRLHAGSRGVWKERRLGVVT
ncbi:hypothetical protein [Deinococcus sp.]